MKGFYPLSPIPHILLNRPYKFLVFILGYCTGQILSKVHFTDCERCHCLCCWPRPQACRVSCNGSKRCRGRRAEGRGRRRGGECRSQRRCRRPGRGATAQRRGNDPASLYICRCRNGGGGSHPGKDGHIRLLLIRSRIVIEPVSSVTLTSRDSLQNQQNT